MASQYHAVIHFFHGFVRARGGACRLFAVEAVQRQFSFHLELAVAQK
jgi:hypothetical protein